DGQKVPVLNGDRPAWRALSAGADPGPDIAALNTSLVDLGYAQGLAGNVHFTAATEAAVKRWQRALGVTVTGRVDLGQVVFARAYLLHPGDPVTVTLPDARTTTPGAVSAVSPVAVTRDDQNGRPGQSTVDVSVTLTDPGKVAAYTTAPVSVSITTGSVKGVLAVPVTALLALPGGGFAVT